MAFGIENAGGAWQEEPRFSHFFPWRRDDDDGVGVVSQHVFVGDDGYESFIVAADWTDGELHGFIIEGELPVSLEPWSAE